MHLIQLLLISCLLSHLLPAGQAQDHDPDDELIKKAATEIIGQLDYCALITLDASGHPQARTMEPFPPEENFVIWFGTNRNSRKVNEIKNNPRVTVYYADESGNGYVTINGTAILVDDATEKEIHWMKHWDRFYPDRDAYLLIKVIPHRLEVVSYAHDLEGDSITWQAPYVDIKIKNHE